MLRFVRYWSVFCLPPLALGGAVFGGAWSWSAVLFVFLMVPLLDAVVAPDLENPPEEGQHERVFDLPLFAWVPAQLGMIAFVLYALGHGDLQGWERAGVLLSCGLVAGGGGINVAHELMHRKGRLERALAEVLMTSTSYTHFCVEHVLGHHRNVSTPADAASARYGETFWGFWARCVPASLFSAWRLERARALRLGLPAHSLHDRRNRYPLVMMLVYFGVWIWLGWAGVLNLAIIGAVAITLLEAINYVEHYGLRRAKLATGRWERVRPEHSWNSPHRVSNALLFNLARHSDHHYLASRPYDRLRHHDAVPQLPAGYATMLLISLVPPLWFRIMNPRVRAWARRDD